MSIELTDSASEKDGIAEGIVAGSAVEETDGGLDFVSIVAEPAGEDGSSGEGDSDGAAVAVKDKVEQAAMRRRPWWVRLPGGMWLWQAAWYEEFEQLLQLMVPLIISMALSRSMTVVDTIMLGHLGVKELAAAGLASTWCRLPFTFVIGMATALDTFASQSYGAGRMEDVGVWTQRAAVIFGLLSIPMAAVFIFTEQGLIFLGENAELAALGARFSLRLLPSIWLDLAFQCLRRWCQAQKVVKPFVYVSLVAAVLNVGANLLFISWWGFNGSPIATTFSKAVQLILLAGYVWCKGIAAKNGTWQGWSRRALRWRGGLYTFLKLAVAGGVMVSLEAWSFQTTFIMVGHLGTLQLDAHGALINFVALCYLMLPYSAGVAGSVRVGHHMGGNQPEKAKLVARLTMRTALTMAACLAAMFILARDKLGYIFSDDARVAAMVSTIAWVAAVFQLTDAFQGVSMGLMRGVAMQSFVVKVNLVGFWMVGVPSSVVLGLYTPLGLRGVWWGLAAGTTTTSLIYLVVLRRMDWHEQARLTKERLAEEKARKLALLEEESV